MRAARATKRRSPVIAVVITTRQISSMTSAPKRRMSLRTVDSSGSRSDSAI
jgi:hypothetical protein